jgi:hypothetical protein
MHETLSNAAANFGAIDPNIQQAIGLLLLSGVLGGIGAGMAIGWILAWARH